MISGIFIVSAKGETLISRFYRDDIKRSTTDAFRHEIIQAKNVGVPVVYLDNSSFMYYRQGDVFIVAVSKKNANITLVFQFLYKLADVLRAYFGGNVDENTVVENFVLIYELLDETMDYGYPQLTSVDFLQQYIKVADVKDASLESAAKAESIVTEVTGAVDWRQKDKYKYKKNEVFIDVLESVNLLMSNQGQILKADVSGKTIMKSFLSGMPECKFGLNDKLVLEEEAKKKVASRRRPGAGIAIDDVSFHRCVRLGQFDLDRTISFIPPDGEFELMKYRITQNVNLPFRVIPVVTEHGRDRVDFKIQIKANIGKKQTASNVLLKIPVPKNTAKVKITDVGGGKAKYQPEHQALVWKIKKYSGNAAYTLKAEARLQIGITEKQWSRPPIVMDFNVPMFTASGLHVRFLKVFEQANYQTIKWVRYITKAGQYEIRM